MKYLRYMILLVLCCGTLNASQRKVLVEIFTNAHCPLCPPAHVQISNYMENGVYAEDVTYIFYHMNFPYPDDALNSANREDPEARNLFYGPFSITPQGFFDGRLQNENYLGWGSIIDDMTQLPSPYEITIGKNGNSQNFSIDAKITQTGEVAQGNLVVNFVAVENVNYTGRNGVSDNKFVMRKMFPTSNGVTFSTTLNQAIVVSQDIDINSKWNTDELGFVVFIQDRKTKEVYQSEYISYNSLVTDVEETKSNLPLTFHLSQNYPNPFNPTTTIKYSIRLETLHATSQQHVVLKVYDLLGNEVATLVNEDKSAGNYSVKFNANGLSSGLYFYKLTAGNFVETKKMLLLK